MASIDTMDALEASISTEFSLSGKKAHDIVSAVFEGTKSLLVASVKDPQFRLVTKLGVFETRKAAPKVGRNPRTGETIHIPAKNKLIFKPTKAIVDAGL
jgi:DNA-binding protein HU-beta